MGRKKVYEDGAARLAAYREKKSRVEITVSKDMHQTLEKIATANDVSVQTLCRSVLKFGLTNHDWLTRGILHREAS